MGPLRIDCRARKFVEVSMLRVWELMGRIGGVGFVWSGVRGRAEAFEGGLV